MNTRSLGRPSWAIVVLMLTALACNLSLPGAATEIPATSPPSAAVRRRPRPPRFSRAPCPWACLPSAPTRPVISTRRPTRIAPWSRAATSSCTVCTSAHSTPIPWTSTSRTWISSILQGYDDGTWGYASITLQKADANGGLPGQYGVELDLDRDGRGEWLIRVAAPSSTDWSRQGVQAWKETNGDVGGVAIMTADSKPRGGDGYDELVFDEGNSDPTRRRLGAHQPERPERPWNWPSSSTMIGNPKTYAMGAWAGTV